MVGRGGEIVVKVSWWGWGLYLFYVMVGRWGWFFFVYCNVICCGVDGMVDVLWENLVVFFRYVGCWFFWWGGCVDELGWFVFWFIFYVVCGLLLSLVLFGWWRWLWYFCC